MNKRDFPFFRAEKLNFIYADSAATALRPTLVLEELDRLYSDFSGSARRGLYDDSEHLTQIVENTRSRVARFLKCESDNIIFTKNTTESLNLVALGWGETNIHEGEEIVVTAREHHANFIPWQQLALRKKARFVVIPVNEKGELPDNACDYITTKTKIFAVGHVSNVTGVIFKNLPMILDHARGKGACIIMDGAQAVSFVADPLSLNPDFYSFSAHKMCGPYGVGILYVSKQRYNQMQPAVYGGGSVIHVTDAMTEFMKPPLCFEPGTLSVPEIGAFSVALDYLDTYGVVNNARHSNALVRLFLDSIDDNITVIGCRERIMQESHLVSFVVKGYHAHDVAHYLATKGIAVRAGNHCAQPFHQALGVDATVRASFYGYNTESDVEKLLTALTELF